MANLTTVALVKQSQDIDSDADDAYIGTLVEAASKMIESICKRVLVQVEGTLYFDAAPPSVFGQKLFFGEDVARVDALIDGSGTLTSDKYYLLPYNSSPKYGLQLTQYNSFSYNSAQHAITLFGVIGAYPENAIPYDLRQAATKLAQWMYVTRDNSGDTVRFANGDITIPAEAPPQVMTILEKGRYIKDRAFVAGYYG